MPEIDVIEQMHLNFEKYKEDLVKGLEETSKDIVEFVKDFIEKTVKPYYETRLAEVMDDEKALALVSRVIGKLDSYAEAFSVKRGASGLDIHVEPEYEEAFHAIEFGSMYTQNFPHLASIEKLLAQSMRQVNESVGHRDDKLLIQIK